MHGTAGLAVQSIIVHTAFRLKLLIAAPPHAPALQAVPAPTTTRPECRSCPPAPAGLEQTHKSINSNRTGISGGSDHYHMCLGQQQNTAEPGIM